MKRLILMIGVCLSFFCVTVSAQKKEIATAMDQVKKGQNLSQAQASMEKLLKDSKGMEELFNHPLLYSSALRLAPLANLIPDNLTHIRSLNPWGVGHAMPKFANEFPS